MSAIGTKVLKVGSKVRVISFGNFEGIVEKIIPYNPSSPDDEHGIIEIKVTAPGNCKFLKAGNIEHVVHYQYDKHIEIIE